MIWIVFSCCFQSSYDRYRFLRQRATLGHMKFNRHVSLPWHKTLSIHQFIAVCTSSINIHTYIHPFNGPLSGTTRVSRYQKSKTNLDFTEARDSEWQWHQLGHMQVCTSFQTDNHASTQPLSFFTGRMPFLPPNQQRQNTEGKSSIKYSTMLLTTEQLFHSKNVGLLVLAGTPPP